MMRRVEKGGGVDSRKEEEGEEGWRQEGERGRQ